MRKNYLTKMALILVLSLFGLANANAQFLENTPTVDIVQIPAFDGDGAKDQRYLADVDEVITFSLEQNEASQWYKIPAGGVSDGTADVQAYYYKNVATGRYLAIDEATLAQLATERDGDWPTEPAGASATNDGSLGLKWFERTTDWPWGMYLSNAAGIDLEAKENNRIYSLTSITIMKNEGEEFFGVYFPHAAVGGFFGGGGNAWTAVKNPVVVEAGVANPDTFLDNPVTVDIVQIPAFDGDGAKDQRYLADVEEVVTFSLEQNEASQWYKIPAGGVSDGTTDVQAYYYKNVATGRYLAIDEATLAQLATERDGDWPTEPAGASAINDGSLGLKWFERASEWPWGMYLSNAAEIDLTAKDRNQIYSLTSITIMKNEGEEFFGVYFPHAAVGGFHGGGGNAWTAVKNPVVVEAGVANPDLDNPLPLDGLNLIWGDNYSYDPESHTLSFAGVWAGGVGWEYNPLQDWTAYQSVTIEFTEPLVTGVALHVEYTEAGVQEKKPDGGDVDAFVGAGATEVTLPLWIEHKHEVKKVYFQMQNDGDRDGAPGTVTLKAAYLTPVSPALKYSIDRLNFFAHDGGEDPNASSYNAETHTITYNDAWRRAGWNFEPDGGLDASGHEQVYLEFDATALAGEGENPADYKLQFDIEYMDGSKETNSGGGYEGGNEYRANVTEAWWNLTHAGTQKIKLITLKSERAGDVVLKDAGFRKSPGAVDLIITDVRWEPESPKTGDKVVFFATIKNIGDKASPSGTKHGVVFQVNNSGVTWCDGFHGPMAPDEEVEVSSTMEGSTGGLWTCGANATYNIRAWANDTRDVTESDYDNNYSEVKVLSVNTALEDLAANKGVVYYANGALHVINYPSSASLTVYNAVGKTVSELRRAAEATDMALPAGIYLVKVQYEGKTVVHKLAVK